MSEKKVMTQVLKGFKDFLPHEMILREWIIRKIEDSFKMCGFLPLYTPAIEYTELLLGKYGDEGEKLIYRFKDWGDRDVSLRYDLTVPLARVISNYKEIPKPFRRYQIAPVWRAEKPAKGRFREFYQCDVDIVGSSSPIADAEIVIVGIEALKSIGLKNFFVKINHRKILNGILSAGGIEEEKRVPILRIIDKLEKQGIEGIEKLLEDECSLKKSQVQFIAGFFKEVKEGIKKEELKAIGEKFFEKSEEGLSGIKDLYEIVQILIDYGYEEFVKIDLSIARGLDYYTGAVFETELVDFKDLGSIMSGGRYDTLISELCGEEMPAVGISIGIDRLFSALKNSISFPEIIKEKTLLIIPIGKKCLKDGLKLLKKLRDYGISSEISLDYEAKLKKQLSYANKKSFEYVILIGEEEIEKGKYILRNMKIGQQCKYTEEEILKFLIGDRHHSPFFGGLK